MAYVPPHLRSGQFNYKFIKPDEKVEENIQEKLNSDHHFPSLGKTITKQVGGVSYAEQAEIARQKFEEEKMNSRIQAERERLRKERIEKQKLEDELIRKTLPSFKKKVVEDTVQRYYQEETPQDDGWTTVERKKPKAPKQKVNYNEVPEDMPSESEHDSEGSDTYWGPAGKEYSSWR